MKAELLFITPNAERLIEDAARTSYLSFEKKGEETEKKLIRMLIKLGHHSVLEHAYATVRISEVSRSFTHQFVRHRLCSFTQQSQRYVDESDFKYVEPDSIKNNSETHLIFKRFMENAKKAYSELKKRGAAKEDARFVLPNATQTEIVVTANLREWRHIIELRGKKDAQWEIRGMVIKILDLLRKHAPTVFEDFKVDKEKEVIKKYED